MSLSSVTARAQLSSQAACTPSIVRLAAGFYAIAAVAPLLMVIATWLLPHVLPKSLASVFEVYLRLDGLAFFGGSAACAWSLVRRNRKAVWGAVLPLASLAITQALHLGVPQLDDVWAVLGVVLFALMLVVVVQLRRQRVLQ